MQIGPIVVDEAALKALCEKWGIAELAAFGSVLREDFGPESDVDLLVTWQEGRVPRRLFDIIALKDEFEEMLGRPVDLLERQIVESDENPYRRRGILRDAESFYVAA
jgi:predicted nucleotidyltransferase